MRVGAQHAVRTHAEDVEILELEAAVAAGEKIQDSQWHNVVAWGKTAEIAEKFLKKGSKVAIEGRLNNRQYETDKGEKKYITEVVANEVLMLTPKG